jgi:hypothetical protein
MPRSEPIDDSDLGCPGELYSASEHEAYPDKVESLLEARLDLGFRMLRDEGEPVSVVFGFSEDEDDLE